MARSRKTKPEPTAADVRTWARENGIEVGNRGWLSTELVDRYKAATR